MTKQEVFNALYLAFESGAEVTVELQEAAHNHGIRVEAVEEAALAARELDEDDFDE